MKLLTTFLLLFPVLQGFAQDTKTIEFSFDTLRIDSFFLVETTTYQAQDAKRPTTYSTPFFFSDTTALNTYIEAKKQRLVDLEAAKNQIATEYTEVTDQVSDLEALRDSVFRGVTGSFIRQIQPAQNLNQSKFSKPSPTSESVSWLIYEDPKGSAFGVWFVPYKPDLPIKNDGFLLKPDGTFEKVRRKRGN